MSNSVIIAARRSPIVPRGGVFAHMEIQDLAKPVISAVLADADISPLEVEELIVSNALGAGGNPARVIALASGLADRIAGLSIDRQCAGGLDAVLIADALVQSGVHDIVLAGGVESYSRRPIRYRTFPDGRAPEVYEQARFTPWLDRDPDMAKAAQALSVRLDIDRSEQDQWSIRSHLKALDAPPLPEIVEMAGVKNDPFARPLSERHCAKAPIIADPISVANMAVAADAAAFVVVTTKKIAQRLNVKGAEILGGLTLGGQPEMPGLAPVAATNEALNAQNLSVSDIDRAEIMEAFAIQAIACVKGIGLPSESVNLDGGALARGHPIGASGTVLATRLFHGLQMKETGLAAIAAAGGIGTALLLKRIA